MTATLEAKRTIKVPERLYREATIKAEGEGKDRTFSMSISSDTPYKRYDWWDDEEYWEVLDHSDEAMDTERLKAGLPILFNHDRDQHLARATSFECDGHKCSVSDFIWSESESAQSKKRDALSGALPTTSIGYSIEDEGVCVGAKDELPIYKFKFKIYEASLVTVPADISVGVGRQRSDKPKGEPKEISIRSEIPLDVSRNSENARTTEKPPKGTKAMSEKIEAPEIDVAAERADERRIERERVKKINDHVGSLTNEAWKKAAAEIAVKAIEDGADFETFRTAANNAFESVSKQQIDTSETERDGKGKKGGQSIGHRFVNSPQFKSAITRRAQGERVASLDVEYSVLGVRGKVEMAQRAGFTSSDLAPVNVQIQTGVIGLGVQRLTIMDLIAPGTTAAAAIIYPRENSFGTVDGVAVAAGAMPRAKSVGERGIKPLWEPDLTTETANVKKIAITTKVPDEFMADFPAAQSFIDERLPFMVDTETEFQILYGDGLGNNLKGITAMPGVQTRAITTTDDSTISMSLMKGLTDIRVNSFFEPDAYAFHPYDWETAKLLRDANRNFLAGGPYYIPFTNNVYMEMNTFWGKPVVVSTAVTYGKPLAGCWKLGAQYFIREGMRLEMTNANEDDFRRNLIMLRAEHRLALAVYRPIAFLEFTGMPART